MLKKAGTYLQLHLNILLFSFTGVFSKLASIQYNKHGLNTIWLYVCLALMVLNCGIYAIAWQKVIKKFKLTTAYANKSVTIIWSQIWAMLIFQEDLSLRNVIGMLVVFVGVMVVQIYE